MNRMIFDFSKLRGRIIEKYGRYDAFAKAIDLSPAQLCDRLNNKIQFKPGEIYRIASAEVLDIPVAEIHRYFLTPKV